MIKNFACKETQIIWKGKVSKRFPRSIQNRALNKLRLIGAAITLSDLKAPPGNKLEKLKGDRKGQYSIRISGQWRICFSWEDNHAQQVEIVDYH